MSSQTDGANAFARRKLGAKADEAAAALNKGNLTVLPGAKDGDGGNDAEPKKLWIRLPTINWTPSQFAREIGQVMADEELFQREGVVVRIDESTGRLEAVTQHQLVTELERWFVFYQLKIKEEEPVKLPMGMTPQCAKTLLEATEFKSRLRRIDRVNRVRMPVIRRDGRVQLLPEGYDAESRIYTLRNGLPIDEEMPKDKAVAVLDALLKEFPFETPRDKAVQVCMMVSLFGTCMLPFEAARMGFVVRSNDRGGGKSLLVEAAIAGPFGLPATADIRDRNKLGETLDSAALQSEAYIFFDNLEGVVKNPMIDNFITAKARRVRLFHTQKTVEVVPGSMLLFTGNNLEVSPDIDRRTLLCRLYVEEFDLQERKIANVIDVNSLLRPAVRAELLSALWSLVRHWRDNSRPVAGEQSAPYRRASFKDWSDIFGGIVQAAGYGNPLVVPSDEVSAAPERVHQRRLVEMLADRIDLKGGKRRYVVKDFQEIVDICHEQELFPWKMDGKILDITDGSGEKVGTEFRPTPATLSWLGRFMADTVCSRGTGRTYNLPGGRVARIGYEGKGRSRVWWVQLENVPQAKA
jgi:hypothetical protein